MDNLLFGMGMALSLALVAGIVISQLLASGRLGPRYQLSRAALDAIRTLCFSLAVPLFTVLFLAGPHAWGPNDYRNSSGFRVGMVLFTGAVEVLVLIGTVRAISRWRRG